MAVLEEGTRRVRQSLVAAAGVRCSEERLYTDGMRTRNQNYLGKTHHPTRAGRAEP